MQLQTSGVSNKLSELSTTPEHDQTLVIQTDELPLCPQAITSFLHGSNRKYPTPY